MADKYNFNLKAEADPYEVHVDTAAAYGYFENVKRGGEGGLWFRPHEGSKLGLELIDYDGYAELPKKVANALIDMGCHLDPIYTEG